LPARLELTATSKPAPPSPPGLRWLGLGIAVLVTEFALIRVAGVLGWSTALFVLLPLAHLLLVPFLWRNWSFWGCRFVAAGLILNLVAMVSNGGLMPVNAAAVLAVGRDQPSELTRGTAIPGTKNYFAGNDGVRFRFLTDDIIVALPVIGTKAVSVGDLAALAGGLILYVEGTTRAGLWRYLVAGKTLANGVPQ
jgi:hypothetical protein